MTGCCGGWHPPFSRGWCDRLDAVREAITVYLAAEPARGAERVNKLLGSLQSGQPRAPADLTFSNRRFAGLRWLPRGYHPPA